MGEIVDDLNVLEAPINGFFDDVEALKSHNHPEANDFYRQYALTLYKLLSFTIFSEEILFFSGKLQK